MRQRRCGNCAFYKKIAGWSRSRDGLCGKFDYNVSNDGSYARKCKGYRPIKYSRLKLEEIISFED